MNYNSTPNVRSTATRKVKRVSDVNAMGLPNPSGPGPRPLENPSATFAPFDPYNPTNQMNNASPNYGFQASYIPPQAYPAMPQQGPIPTPGQKPFTMLSQPIVHDMAFQYGQQLADTGKAVVKQELEKYVAISRLKYYFAVDTRYVISKLRLLLFPFTHKDWSIKYEQDNPVQPRYEINAPDLYIPVMAYVTYVVLAGLVLGVQDRFTPEQIGIYASSALAWSLIEIAVYTATLYITNMKTTLKTFDLLAYSGYKYVGIILSVLTSLVFALTGYYIVLLYSSATLAFFLVRALKAQVLPEHQSDQSHHYGAPPTGSKRRLYFLLFVSLTQPLISWWLSLHLVRYTDNKSNI